MTGRKRIRLTDATIARPRPGEREYTVWDSRVAGLGVRVRPSGGRSYVLLLQADGRSKRISLGPAALKTVEEARRECHALSVEALAGNRRKSDADAAPAFHDFVAGAWKQTHFDTYKPSTREGVRYVLDRQLLPAFGTIPLDCIVRPNLNTRIGRNENAFRKALCFQWPRFGG